MSIEEVQIATCAYEPKGQACLKKAAIKICSHSISFLFATECMFTRVGRQKRLSLLDGDLSDHVKNVLSV